MFWRKTEQAGLLKKKYNTNKNKQTKTKNNNKKA